MRLTLAIALLASGFGGFPAYSQEICRSIAGYFVDAPDGFVAERGQPAGSHSWHSNADDDCTIYETDNGHRHRVVCFFNLNGSPDDALGFYRANEIAIDACIAALPNASEYEKRMGQRQKDGVTTVSTSWSASVDSNGQETGYRISLAGHVRSDGTAYNSMQVSVDLP